MVLDLAWVLLARYAVLWVLLRSLASLALLVAGGSLGPSPGFSLRFAVLLAVVAYVDLRRRGERILWANLGVGLSPLLVGAFCVGLFAEAVLGLGLSALPHSLFR